MIGGGPEVGRLSRRPVPSLLLELDPGQRRRPPPWVFSLISPLFFSSKRLQPDCRPDNGSDSRSGLYWANRTYLLFTLLFLISQQGS